MTPFDPRAAVDEGWFLCEGHDEDALRLMAVDGYFEDDDFQAWTFVIRRAFQEQSPNHIAAIRLIQKESPREADRLYYFGMGLGFDIREPTLREMEDARYAGEPWAKLAMAAGFRPHDTESAARDAFRWCAENMVLKSKLPKEVTS